MQVISDAIGVAPAWLAWGRGPKDPRLAAEQETIAARMEQWPGFREFLEDYAHLGQASRDSLHAIARQMQPAIQRRSSPGGPADVTGQAAALETPARRPAYKEIPHPPAPVAQEEPLPLKVVPLERKVTPANRRHEFPVFTLCKNGKLGARPMPMWLDLAAGYGEDLEACDDLWYVREFPRWANMHLARIRGDSMLETLLDNDVVLLEGLGPEGKGYALPKERLTRTQMESFIKNDSICMLRLNGTVTVKRLRYDGRGEEWDLYIEAENPVSWRSYRVKKKDDLIIYATVKGLAR